MALFPLICVKVAPLNLSFNQTLFSFLGISYLTFKSVGMIIEMRDGTLKEVSLPDFIRFMIFSLPFPVGQLIASDAFKKIIISFLIVMTT